MRRIGVFICHCGTNISATVDVARVAEVAKGFADVVFSTDNKYMCSDPGQQVIKNAIREHELEAVVVASCSPRMHELTFRRALEDAGLNPYLLEMANLREQCSWVHKSGEETTAKAIDLVRAACAKASRNIPLQKSFVGIEKKALVVGGGIAGIQAALDIADAGYQTVIVEREPTIGGKMAMLDKTFPTLDCSACILTPKMVDAAQHESITLMTYSEIEKVEGYIGNFEVTIRRKARSVDLSKCTGCGICCSKCPQKNIPSEFDQGLGTRSAIYTPFPQAVPNKPVIDRANCTWFKTGKCGVCSKVCPTGAVDYTQEDELITERFGAIVMATGYDLFKWDAAYGEYGYGRYPDVITGMQFERLVNASGPTSGKIKRPSDHTEPKNVVFIKCVGSRDRHKGKEYCSKACCMYTAKHATQFMEKVKDGQAFVFYMDVRTPGKGYEEFYNRTTEEFGACYLRGRVSRIYPKGDRLLVKGEDTLSGQQVEIEADMVVLANAMVSQPDAGAMARKLSFSYDANNFFTEAHPKLKPVETNTAGIYLAGCCQGPKDIPDTVAQASAAASKVIGLLSKSKLATDPMVTEVNEARCSGCQSCMAICPYKAMDVKMIQEKVAGQVMARSVATVNSTLCHGCGACTVACNAGAINLKGFSNDQILAEVDAICL